MGIKSGAAALSILSNTTLVIIKLVVGLLTGSVSIISEAAHSATDLAASFMAYFSVRAADVPADDEHPFGHGKIENVSGVIEAILIFLAAGYIVFESIRRFPSALRGDYEVDPLLGIIVMLFSAIANFAISSWLFKVAKDTDSTALAADAQHLQADVWTSAGVFLGLVLIQITGLVVLDPIIALMVALMIIRAAYRLTKEAGAPLVDARLPQREIDKVIDILLSDRRIVGFHKLRTRKAGAERHIDVHILVSEKLSIGEAHELAEQIEDEIRSALGGVH
ncbi:MAG TPA: cation diffusion facilitator family transporter, partial [Armatimonadota bacterium]|nr:cation diffusion facilitator family transporter [Armatimonadota bacterium]